MSFQIIRFWSFFRLVPWMVGFAVLSLPGHSWASVAQNCDAAAQNASNATGVPLNVLLAITRTETGRRKSGGLEPWPWTVNMEGDGNWFDTEDEARAYVFRHFKRGARSFDVGCFQINYKWHGQAFSSIDDMFDPQKNAVYAAQFLRDLHKELGSWSKAAGAFHSRTPKFANRYIQKFETIYAGLGPNRTVTPPVPTAEPPTNQFPLLVRSSAPRQLGSLVPMGSNGPRSSLATLMTEE